MLVEETEGMNDENADEYYCAEKSRKELHYAQSFGWAQPMATLRRKRRLLVEEAEGTNGKNKDEY